MKQRTPELLDNEELHALAVDARKLLNDFSNGKIERQMPTQK